MKTDVRDWASTGSSPTAPRKGIQMRPSQEGMCGQIREGKDTPESIHRPAAKSLGEEETGH